MPEHVSTFEPLRREDTALLTGRGCFVHDVQVPGMAHAVFVRSGQAHGRLLGLDTEAARRMPVPTESPKAATARTDRGCTSCDVRAGT